MKGKAFQSTYNQIFADRTLHIHCAFREIMPCKTNTYSDNFRNMNYIQEYLTVCEWKQTNTNTQIRVQYVAILMIDSLDYCLVVVTYIVLDKNQSWIATISFRYCSNCKRLLVQLLLFTGFAHKSHDKKWKTKCYLNAHFLSFNLANLQSSALLCFVCAENVVDAMCYTCIHC